MGRYLPCPLPCHAANHHEHSDLSQTNPSSDSSSNSSLSSQLSLPSVPSLTSHNQYAAAAAAAFGGSGGCIATLKGHSSFIFSLALAGKYLYSGASNGEIRVWSRNPNASLSPQNYTVSEGYSAVKSIAVLGEKIFTAHSDHRIRVWKIDSKSMDFPKHKLITTLPTLNDRCIRLFSAKNYVEVRRHKRSTWIHHVDAVSALALSNDAVLLYSVSWDRSLKIWRTSDFRCVESVQNAHDDAINAVVASADGSVYTGSADKLIKVWRKRIGEKKHELVRTMEKHRSAVNALALSGDGSVLYSGACDRSIIVWEKDGGGEMAVAGALRGHRKAILCLAVVADLLCSGSADRTVRIWRRGSGSSYSCLAVFEGHKSPVKCLAAADFDNNSNNNRNNDIIKKSDNNSGNSYLVYSGGLDFDIKVWQIFVPN